MNVWPKTTKELKKITIFLLIGFFLTLILLFQLQARLKNFVPLNFAPAKEFSTLKSPLEPHDPFCLPNVNEGSSLIINGLIRTFPHCLTVTNSRFGSRFNFDWYSSRQAVRSGVLGVLEDANAYFHINVEDENKIDQLFPMVSQAPEYKQSIDLGLTYQKINFENNDLLLGLSVNSPFAPSSSFADEAVKMSSAPFFYLNLTAVNKSAFKQKKAVTLSLGNALNIIKKDGLTRIYFNESTGTDGAKVLAYPENINNIQSSISKKHGLIKWQVDLEPQSSSAITFIYAGYFSEPVITDVNQKPQRNLYFIYTKWFDNIDEIVNFASVNKDNFSQKQEQFEGSIEKQNLSPQIKWLLSQSFHSYLGNTWLVWDKEKNCEVESYVWEGEFKYFNTLDVAHDYAVLSGLYFPWTLKSELSSWQTHAKEDELGTVIPHDLGSRFHLRPYQDFKIPGWQNSGMPVEENANFILLSYWYWYQTKDDQYLEKIAPFLRKLTDSLISRDTNNNGIADREIRITTYDNEGNTALNRGPDNTYLGIKQLAAYILASKIFKMTKDNQSETLVDGEASKIVTALKQAYDKYGYLPLSLDPDFKEKNLFNDKTVLGIEEQGFAFITGLFYPSLTKIDSPHLKELIPLLTQTYPLAYQKSLVYDEGKIMGLKLAQYQDISLGWFSHSVMADFIAKRLFSQEYHSEKIFFPLLYDSSSAFTDGFYFKKPFYPPQTALTFYPRGVALFANLAKN